MSKTICFTGRRAKELGGYIKSNYSTFIDELVNILKSHVTEDITFISGGAQGFDQLAFWAVDKMIADYNGNHKIENVVYVPFKGQEKAWLENGLFSQNEYKNMLSNATNVVYLNDVLTDRNAIVQALYDRNHSMVNDADIVIALYADDDWNTAKGGTAECMRYAKRNNKTIIQLKYTKVNNKLHIAETKTIQAS